MNQRDSKKLDRVEGLRVEESASKDSVEKSIAKLKSDWNNERFLYFFIIVLLIDMRIFPSLDGLSSLTLGILQLILLLFIGNRLEVKYVARLFNRILRTFSKSEKS